MPEDIQVSFTAEIQRDGRIQLPSNIRNKLDLNKGDVLQLTIDKKL